MSRLFVLLCETKYDMLKIKQTLKINETAKANPLFLFGLFIALHLSCLCLRRRYR
jgi:hypothetical protein